VLTFVTLRGETPTEGATMARDAASRDDRDPVHWNNLGVSRLQLGDVAGASEAFERAVALDPTLPGPYYNLAILTKFFLLDDGTARDWFARYRTLSTDDPDGLAEVFEADPAPTLAERDAPAAAEVPTVALKEES
jgi:Tfp pilus assembly protein PilF